MPHKTRVILLVVVIAILGSLGALFLYVRALLPEIPHKVAQSLKEKQIDFKFKDVTLDSWKLKVMISAPELSGSGIPYLISFRSLSLAATLKGFPSLSVVVEANAPAIDLNTEYRPSEPQPSGEKNGVQLPALVATTLKASTLEVVATDMKATPWGIDHLNFRISIKDLAWKGGTDFRAQISHSISLPGLADKPLIPKIEWTGITQVAYPSIGLEAHQIAIGPIPVALKGKVDVKSLHWSLNLDVPPSSDLSKLATPSLLPPSIRSLTGKFGLQGEAQGVGGELALIQGKANLAMESLKLDVNHPSVNGPVEIEGTLDITGGQTTGATGKLKIDLTKALVRQEKQFEKPAGIPFVFGSDLNISPTRAEISNASLTLHNLALKARGSSSLKPPYVGAFWADISPTELNGWERFFPAHASIHTEGSLSGNIDYKGNFQEWKTAEISLDLLAKKIKIPVLKNWLPENGTQINGILLLDSQTKLSLGRGEIRSLATKSNIDLTQSQVVYGKQFNKPMGKVLAADILIKSTAKKATIEKGALRISNSSLTTKGVVENFARPSVKLSFQSSPIQALELLSLTSKEILPAGLSNLYGQFSVQGTIQGPLLDKKQPPKVLGNVAIANLGLKYLKPESKHVIDLKNLTGKVAFSNDSLSATNMKYVFPGSMGTLGMSVNNFENPKVDFRLTAERFQLKDFMPPGSAAPTTGAVPVVATAQTKTNSKANDPRNNPYAKKLSVNGLLQLKNADLGSVKAEMLDATLTYHNLKLSIAPLTIKTFGGTVISKTYWDGQSEIPSTKQEIETSGVDANQFISWYSENGKNILNGKLNSKFVLNFKGLEAATIKSSLAGSGTFELKDGKLSTIRLTKGPMESLKSLPVIGSKIQKTDWDESLQSAKGSFKIENGKLLIAGLDMKSPYFDALTSNATISVDQQLAANTILYPSDKLLAPDSLEIIKDNSGRAALPLTISGDVKSPRVSLDSNVIQDRIKSYATRRAEEEKRRAISSAQEKAKKAVEDGVKNKINTFFK